PPGQELPCWGRQPSRRPGSTGGPCAELLSGRWARARARCIHPRCPTRLFPAASTQSVVPPTPTTFGDETGQSAPYFAPLSPLAATKVTPLCPAGVVKNGS